MPNIWINEVFAPVEVFINKSFEISWEICVRGFPKKYKIYSKIEWDNEIYEEEYDIRACIFSKKITTTVVIPGINVSTVFYIQVGLRD